MTKMLSIDYDTYTENLGGSSPDDEWSRDSTKSSYTVNGASIAKQHGDCPISDCEVGDKVYVVWADYTTGDTFGSDSAVEFLAAFKSKTHALRCVDKATHKTDSDNYTSWDIEVTLDEGEKYQVHIPWLGYFEHLKQVNITEVTVTE